MKYVVFDTCDQKVVINRSSIVGFRVPDARIIWTNIILDSGAEVPLNGMRLEDAEANVTAFDAQKKSEGAG